MIKFVQNNKDSILLFCLLFLLFFLTDIDTCSKILSQKFDSQMILTWQYSLAKGYFPIIDLFYPYGFFQYFKDSSITLSAIAVLVKALLFVFFYIAFKVVFKSRILSFISFSSLFIFVTTVSSISVFGRYGLLLAFSLAVGLLLFKGYGISRPFNFVVGALVGLIFYVLPDQAFLAVGVYVAIIISNFSLNFIKSVSYSFLGLLVFVIPFFATLIYTDNFSLYINSFTTLKDISSFAKIPFPPGIFTNDNVFTILTLTLSISVLSYRILILKIKKTIHDIALFASVVPLILLEQKNVLRSIDTQLTFYAIVLTFILLAYFFEKKKGLFPVIYLCIVSVFLIFFAGFKVNSGDQRISSFSLCVDQNLRIANYKTHEKVLSKVKQLGGGQVFSYPQDPVFYVLNDQKPPYFLSIYEASTFEGQELRKSYIKETKIEYVIVNMDIKSTQDNVPDFVRAKNELSFILNNYEPITSVENFLILKKSKNADVFKKQYSSTFAKSLLDVDLELVPYAEARDKSKYLRKKIYSVVGLKELNEKLSSSGLSTVGKQMLVKTLKDGELILTFETYDGNTTIVRMLDCSKGCLVNLNGIPLFYRNRVIRNIASNLNLSEVTFFEEKNSIFW